MLVSCDFLSDAMLLCSSCCGRGQIFPNGACVIITFKNISAHSCLGTVDPAAVCVNFGPRICSDSVLTGRNSEKESGVQSIDPGKVTPGGTQF